MGRIFQWLNVTFLSLFVCGVVMANADIPGWISNTAELMSPQTAKAVLTQQAAESALVSADSALQQADASASSDYTQLAEALENN
ncbi:MAG: hypothetical protein KZQ64_03035, partial [gamma proteobacterium symbiont of Bathyaustriella thionipta]|nr:hypothetical protein [gamma proteobacterium symbiont of Bathyaustriella thionipta]MCU7950520.1 hypothetical protein [gamma proteobacterium symbiont of Bathyaustriella thionipta]MCU7952360.1 hypothetical protein [gamma proteobacterium symbiont of Bathyaustriella thionipta]MCU7967312.1 hypothetical protein [gamma proteobacterium symbiont of Bathyaustriella thionipta]